MNHSTTLPRGRIRARLLALPLFALLAAPASAQLVTYESMTDSSTWSLSFGGPYWSRGTAEPASHFGKVDTLNYIWWLDYSRKPVRLAAGTYRAVIWHKKVGTSGLYDLDFQASFNSTTVTSKVLASSVTVDTWECTKELEFTLDAPANVTFRLQNIDTTIQKQSWLFDSFVLERIAGDDLVGAGALGAWRGGATIRSSGANPWCTVAYQGTAATTSPLYASSAGSTQPAGEYCFTARVRKIVDTNGRMDIRTGSDAPHVSVTLKAADQPVGEWVWLPLTVLNLTTPSNFQIHVHLPQAAQNYEIGEYVIFKSVPQCDLYYKFDRGAGAVVVNYGTEQVSSKMVNMGVGPWQSPGKYGASMLQGSDMTSATHYNYCDTGWNKGFTGDFTVHWWMKERFPVVGNNTYVFGGPSGFRCFTYDPAGASLMIRGASGDILMPTVGASLLARAQAAAGVSVGLVVSGTSAQWYVDGQKHGAAIKLPAAPVVLAGTLNIGTSTVYPNSSIWDIDEFRLCTRAASEAEIKLWHATATAAVGSFGTSCGVTLGTTGGAPRVGNLKYTHTISGPPNMRFLYVIGFASAPFDMGIVFPELKGCTWYPRFDIQLVAATGASGSIALPGPVPNDSSIAGLFLESQVLGFTGSSPSLKFMSNALSHKIEMN